jgi:glutamine synthetase
MQERENPPMMLGCTSPDDVIKAIRDHDIQIVDLRFTDLPGMWQHTSFPAAVFGADAI